MSTRNEIALAASGILGWSNKSMRPYFKNLIGIGCVLVAIVVTPLLLWLFVEMEFNPRIIPDALGDIRGAYLHNNFPRVISKCEDAEKNPSDVGALPQILFFHWAAEHRLGEAHAANSIRRQFLSQYSENPLAADLLFSHAMETLAKGEYEASDAELSSIERRFPRVPLITQVHLIRARLANAVPSGNAISEAHKYFIATN